LRGAHNRLGLRYEILRAGKDRSGRRFRTYVSSLGFETCISSTGTLDPNFQQRVRNSIFDPQFEPAFRSPFRKCVCEKVCCAEFVVSGNRAEHWNPHRFACVGDYFWICASFFGFVWQS
jgi:hypothetical protein